MYWDSGQWIRVRVKWGNVDERVLTNYMNLLIWDVRELNHPSKQREVKRMIKLHKIGLVCLIEIRVKEAKADMLRTSIVPDWGFVFNYEKHVLGRIWICWNQSDFEVTVLDKSDQSISCVIQYSKENLC